MKVSYLDIRIDAKGLAPIVVGQPNWHITDWRGCAFKYVLLPGWKRGHRLPVTMESVQELRSLLKTVDMAALRVALEHVSGSHLGDRDLFDMSALPKE